MAMLMKRAGIAGLSGSRRPRRRPRPINTPVDLVDRNFARFQTGPVVGDRHNRHIAKPPIPCQRGRKHRIGSRRLPKTRYGLVGCFNRCSFPNWAYVRARMAGNGPNAHNARAAAWMGSAQFAWSWFPLVVALVGGRRWAVRLHVLVHSCTSACLDRVLALLPF